MKIELPKIEDLERINKLAFQVHELHVNWRPDIFVSMDTMFIENDLKSIIENKTMYVAKEDEDVLGYATIKLREVAHPGHRYRKEMNIDVIVVDEEHRGKGIGTKLLTFIKDYSKSIGCTDLRLTVNEENKDAIKMYEKFGMTVKNITYSMQI